jgi:hypothetical protein
MFALTMERVQREVTWFSRARFRRKRLSERALVAVGVASLPARAPSGTSEEPKGSSLAPGSTAEEPKGSCDASRSTPRGPTWTGQGPTSTS